jgi:hypothetical protein
MINPTDITEMPILKFFKAFCLASSDDKFFKLMRIAAKFKIVTFFLDRQNMLDLEDDVLACCSLKAGYLNYSNLKCPDSGFCEYYFETSLYIDTFLDEVNNVSVVEPEKLVAWLDGKADRRVILKPEYRAALPESSAEAEPVSAQATAKQVVEVPAMLYENLTAEVAFKNLLEYSFVPSIDHNTRMYVAGQILTKHIFPPATKTKAGELISRKTLGDSSYVKFFNRLSEYSVEIKIV